MGTGYFWESKTCVTYPKGKAQRHSWGQGHAFYNSQSMTLLIVEVNDVRPVPSPPPSCAKWWHCWELLSQIQELGRGSGVCVSKP